MDDVSEVPIDDSIVARDARRLELLLRKDITCPRFYHIHGGSNSGKTTFVKMLSQRGAYKTTLESLMNRHQILPADNFIIVDEPEDDSDLNLVQEPDFATRFRSLEQKLKANGNILIIVANYNLNNYLRDRNETYIETIHFPFNFNPS